MLATLSHRALPWAATFWFVAAAAGQLIFALYIVSLYGGATMRGDLAGWNKVMPHGYVAGDAAGNLRIGLHLLAAAILSLGGALQLTPWIRRHAPGFHRWNGRVYLVSAVAASLLGLAMMWTRGTVGDLSQHLGTSLNAIVILLCAAFVWRSAVTRRFDEHRRWALRLFLAVSGVWFFRVGLMFWLVLNRAPVGFDIKTFTGPFLTFLAFGQYLVPLAVLEVYFRVQRGASPNGRLAMAAGLVGLTLAMGAGIGAATLGMWLPRI